MKQLPLTKQQLIAAMISLSLGSVAQAALTINGSADTSSSARMSWGGADSLSEARNIMYKSKGSAIKKVDSGNGTTSITNANKASVVVITVTIAVIATIQRIVAHLVAVT